MDQDIHISRVDQTKLSHKTKLAILDIIRENAVEGQPFKLPNEDEHSQRLGISRNVLRDVLISLETIGYLTRRRSKGTIANPKIVNAHYRLDIQPELMEGMRQSGYDARTETLRLGFVFENDEVFGPEEDSYLSSEKMFYANGGPAAYCIDRIAGKFAKSAGDSIMRLEDMTHYVFLQEHCNTEMAYTLARVDTALPEPWLQEALKISPSDPVLLVEDEGYNYDHEIVLHSFVYYKKGVMNLKFLRKSWL